MATVSQHDSHTSHAEFNAWTNELNLIEQIFKCNWSIAMPLFWLKFQWCVFWRSLFTISQHWLRWWLDNMHVIIRTMYWSSRLYNTSKGEGSLLHLKEHSPPYGGSGCGGVWWWGGHGGGVGGGSGGGQWEWVGGGHSSPMFPLFDDIYWWGYFSI